MSQSFDQRLPPPPLVGPRPFWVRWLRRPWPPVDVLILKTRTCPLCDEALSLLNRSRFRLGLSVRVLDISDDGGLLDTYGDEVPVVFIDGRKRFFGRVDPVLLAREARGSRRGTRH